MTGRWPIAIFSNMLGISALNAYIIWTLINPDWNARKTHKRRIFIEELGKELIRPKVDPAESCSRRPIKEACPLFALPKIRRQEN
jgi:hypothetical protein